MKVVVIGSGGREHAICWQLARSPRVSEVFACPGNPGMKKIARCWPDCDPIASLDAFIERCKAQQIDHVVIGPEAPLVAGVADRLRSAGIPTFGAGAAAARLEGSKAYSKQFMERHQIPTADHRTIDRIEDLEAALDALPPQVVVKASGLAAGKGVIVCDDRQQARQAATAMLVEDSFGESGRVVVIEERMHGPEVSILAIVDGTDALLLPTAQDHKPLLDGNRGPNTGGMGAFCPGTAIGPSDLDAIRRTIIEPTLEGLVADQIHYSGVLYAGLMMTASGPRVLEYNCRLGDPETQPVLLRLTSDFADILEATADHSPSSASVTWDPRPALCLVLASEGYPAAPRSGQELQGDFYSDLDSPVQVFHAGTRHDGDRCVVSGGRVLGITALGDSLAQARDQAYEKANQIHFEGKIFRQDIGSMPTRSVQDPGAPGSLETTPCSDPY
ncbi:MAG: phosphoribosylamine--glycine ligase [Planctomycetota bacterium]|nr:phosphoribosylamine--glycine ligase [Planctomycetota bacterium]